MTDTIPDNGSGSPDLLERLAVFGVGVDNDLRAVKPFRFSTMQEMLTLRTITQRFYGLRQDQFAENGWGFPYIPYPEDRSPVRERLVLAPENAAPEVIGHPIYWIDPELTRPIGDEVNDPALWCVRMFYVILALGLWDEETLKWYNAPQSRGVQYTSVDISSYRQGEPSVLDRVRYGREDLLISWNDVLTSTARAVEQLRAAQLDQWQRYQREQVEAYRTAQGLLEGAGWNAIEDELQAMSVEVGKRLNSGRAVSDLVAPTYAIKDKVVALLNEMERCNVTLATPVLRELAPDVESYGRVVLLMKEYNDRIVGGGYEDELVQVLDLMFDPTLEGRTASDYAKLHERASEFYMDVWRRLKVASVNHERMERDEPPFESYQEWQVHTASSPDDVLLGESRHDF